jgi:hypothetical protein
MSEESLADSIADQQEKPMVRGLRVYQTDWLVDRDVLKKGYRFNDLVASGSAHYCQILISRGPSSGENQFDYHVDLVFSPSPWPKAADCAAIAKLEVSAKPEEYAVVKLSFEQVDGNAVLSMSSAEDMRAFLFSLAKCRPMRMIICQGLGEPREIPILNDSQFWTMAEGYF